MCVVCVCVWWCVYECVCVCVCVMVCICVVCVCVCVCVMVCVCAVNNNNNVRLFLPHVNLNSWSGLPASEQPVNLGYCSFKARPLKDLLRQSHMRVLWKYKEIGSGGMGKGTWDQAWKPELDLWDQHRIRREPTLESSSDFHTHAIAHTHEHTHTYTCHRIHTHTHTHTHTITYTHTAHTHTITHTHTHTHTTHIHAIEHTHTPHTPHTHRHMC